MEMHEHDTAVVSLNNSAKYIVRGVIFDVTAHYRDEAEETLQAAVSALILTEVQRSISEIDDNRAM